MFLALEDQVRGYPARANGPTAPCQVIQGPNTTLSTARDIAFSKNNFLHIDQFLTNGTINIFRADAKGDVSPLRTVSTETNDLVSIAVDSKLNDFILSIRSGHNILVAPNGTNGQLNNPAIINDADVAVDGIAVDPEDNLVVAGYDVSGAPAVDTLETSKNVSAPPRIRRITGNKTGLLPGSTSYYITTISIAIDPSSGELYVYNASADGTRSQVSVFARSANGNVKPIRVIGGPLTRIGGPAPFATRKISVSGDGRLFVAEPDNQILVFAPGASGNVSPGQIIKDLTIGSASIYQGSIAVRSCQCQ